MKSYSLITSFLIVIALCNHAYADQIKLRDGSIIYGKVVESVNPEVVVVETASGIIPLSRDKVLYVERGNVPPPVVYVAPVATTMGYVALDIGQSTANSYCGDWSQYSCVDSASAFRAAVGVQFNPFFALEGAYVNNGTMSFSAQSTTGGAKTTEFQVDAVGILPFNGGFSTIFKAGITFWNIAASGTYFGGYAPPAENGADFMLGFGGELNFTQHASLRLLFEGRNISTSNSLITNGRIDLNTFYMGLAYKF